MSDPTKESPTRPASEPAAEPASVSRRKFIAGSAAGAAFTGLGLSAIAQEGQPPAFVKKIEPSDTINLGFIGVGVRGRQHMRFTGFFHPSDKPGEKNATANLPRPLNVRAHAMSDCYEARRQWAKEAVPHIQTHAKYQELLADKNIDAIFIGTSDHNHAPVGIDAAAAGKHIYSEKPFAHNIAETKAYRDAVKKADIVFQLGHQTRSGTLMEKARKALGGIDQDSTIGKISLIETYTNRNNANGAWIYKYEGADPGPHNIDWEAFTGRSPKRDFNLDRFFRFRKYWDYGTGQAGDLISHEYDAIQQITGLGVPDTCVATGGVYLYHDGRETPDVCNVAYNYEKEGVIVTYAGTLGNSKPRERIFFGRDGTLDMSKGIMMSADEFSDEYMERIEKGEWEIPISGLNEAELKTEMERVKALTNATTGWMAAKGIYIEIIDGKEVNVTGLHALNFVECVRAGNRKTNCDIDHAFEEGVIVAMANEAFFRGRRVRWDRVREEIVNDA